MVRELRFSSLSKDYPLVVKHLSREPRVIWANTPMQCAQQ
jgi:hypothetical protein